jgi:hypothetical protein
MEKIIFNPEVVEEDADLRPPLLPVGGPQTAFKRGEGKYTTA